MKTSIKTSDQIKYRILRNVVEHYLRHDDHPLFSEALDSCDDVDAIEDLEDCDGPAE